MQPTNVGGGGQGGVGPLTTMLVMDVSGSMDKNNKIDGAKAAAKAYVDQMRPGDQAGLMIYNTQVHYVQSLTDDHAALDQCHRRHSNRRRHGHVRRPDRCRRRPEGRSGRKAIMA